MPVKNHFFLVVVERLKEAPASIKKKDLTANSLQRKTGTAPETTEQKNPQLLSNWGLYYLRLFSRP
jgi:hypothetical protein